MLYLLSIVFNVLVFTLLYYQMPEVSLLIFLAMTLVVPAIYNSLLYIKRCKGENSYIEMIVLAVFTTIAYFLFGRLLASNGKLLGFISSNNHNSDNYLIAINENIVGGSQIIFIFLFQVSILFLLRYILRRKNYD